MTKEEIFQERERNASKVWDTVYSEIFPTMPPSYPNALTRFSMLRFSDQENAELLRELEEAKQETLRYSQYMNESVAELSELKAREKERMRLAWHGGRSRQYSVQVGTDSESINFEEWYSRLNK